MPYPSNNQSSAKAFLILEALNVTHRGMTASEVAFERMHWSRPFEKGTGVVRRGRGFAIAIKTVVSPTTSVAMVNVSADGSATLYCGTVDMGQGSDTAMAQMVAEF